MNVARDMPRKSAKSGNFQDRVGLANIAAIAGASREWPARANKPSGAFSPSLAARNTRVNRAEESALSMARPPTLSADDSIRIRLTRLASWLEADPVPSFAFPFVARVTRFVDM